MKVVEAVHVDDLCNVVCSLGELDLGKNAQSACSVGYAMARDELLRRTGKTFSDYKMFVVVALMKNSKC